MDKVSVTGIAAAAAASALALGVGYWLGVKSVSVKPPTKAEVGSGDTITVDTVDTSTDASADRKQPVILDATARFNRTSVRAATHEAVSIEIDGDVFDRARVMVGWNQALMESQVALVLGVGGIGSSVCFALARLGIKKMYILDRDTVDASNLNRQMLFGTSDVGKRKVAAGLQTLLKYHNLRTEIVPLDMDGVTNWDKIVAVASADCTVIFNNIDYGACFDLAASALAKRLAIPYLAASTYAFNVEITLCKGGVTDSCFTCTASVADSFGHWELKELKEWIRTESGSSDGVIGAAQINKYFCASTHGGRKMVTHTIGDGGVTPPFISEILNSIARPNGVTAEEFVKLFAPAWKKHVIERLVPSRILSYKSIGFIPRDPAFPTRTVGSWICVCAGGTLLMVNKWAQHIMRPFQTGVKPIHTWTKFNIGMEDGCYTLDSALNGIDKFCAVCKDAAPPAPAIATAPATATAAAPVATAAAAAAAAVDVKSSK